MRARGVACLMVVMLIGGLPACMNGGDEDEMKKRQVEIRSDLESKIAEVDRAIERLKEDARVAGEDARKGIDDRIERLEEARDDLAEKLDDVGDTTAEKWDGFVRAVELSLESAEKTLKNI